MYGNTDEEKPEQYKLFPYIMHKICPFFSFEDSRYIINLLIIINVVLQCKNQKLQLRE